jgi:hypothetical protein
MRRNWCLNMNHRRSDAPVRHCPTCGEAVNANILAKKCSDKEHATSRMDRYKYCVHCGLQLVT